MNDVLDKTGTIGAAWGHSSMVHFVVGQDCPRPSDIEWESDFPPPRLTGLRNVSLAFTQAMVNRGVQFMSAGFSGFVSTAHSEQDIEDCLAAFEGAIGDVKAAGLL